MIFGIVLPVTFKYSGYIKVHSSRVNLCNKIVGRWRIRNIGGQACWSSGGHFVAEEGDSSSWLEWMVISQFWYFKRGTHWLFQLYSTVILTADTKTSYVWIICVWSTIYFAIVLGDPRVRHFQQYTTLGIDVWMVLIVSQIALRFKLRWYFTLLSFLSMIAKSKRKVALK